VIYGVQYAIVGTILELPLIIYQGWYREQEFGLSNQTLPQFLTDYGIQFALSAPFFILFIVLLYALIRWTGSRWWMWGSAMAIVLLAIQVLLIPVYFAPAINDYKPLAQGELRDSILSMARANGVPADNVWQFDASRQHKRISANVSGMLGTTQISLNDNLLRRGSIPEVKAVMGHELGHYVLNHIWELLALFTLLLLIGFSFTHWAATRLINRFGGTWRVSGIDDPAGLPVLLAVLAFLGFIATPITNTIIRTNEAEADIFGLNAAREPDGFAMTAMKLSEYRKLNPEPWEEFIFYDHPSGRERVRMAMQWKAEHPNEGQ
jgi:STE24 endopeptidase